MHASTRTADSFVTGRDGILNLLGVELALCTMAIMGVLAYPVIRMQIDGIRITGPIVASHGDGRQSVEDPVTELAYDVSVDGPIGRVVTIVVHPTSRETTLTAVETYVFAVAMCSLIAIVVAGWPVVWWAWRRHLRFVASPPSSKLCATSSGLSVVALVLVLWWPARGGAASEPHVYSGRVAMALIPVPFLLVALVTNRTWRRPDLPLSVAGFVTMILLSVTFVWALEAR